MIITFGSTKGGTGKSTLAVNFTILQASLGKRVLLVDGDEQRSALNFTELRVFNGTQDYTAVALYGASVRSQVQKLSPQFDLTVIDVGGRDTISFRAALTLTNILCIPVQPRTFDVWAIEPVVALVREAQTMNPSLKAFALLNLADVQGQEGRLAQESLSEYQDVLTVLKSPVSRRKVYADAVAKGKSIFEFLPKNKKAIAEFKEALSFLYQTDSQKPSEV